MSELNEKNKLELGSEQIVTFHINNEQLGINIELVQEIIKPPKIFKEFISEVSFSY